MPAAEALRALTTHGWTLAVAESLTGGLLSARVVDVPGASAVHRGAVVAYATDLKGSLLGVPTALLDAVGAVDPDVALHMAEGVRRRLGADVGVATTGVAGPDPQDGHPPGTVHVAVVTPLRREVRSLRVAGDRAQVRERSVEAALRLVVALVEGDDPAAG
ncbi:CinA family protein [Cellulomonas palmilytica]|uniref:CinA family protein n=1 Tax=Cellulomonas palmilytica TaxID=2608402 RepID=UPI001F3243D2|nr:CinA family protein [Cellulomonas palmilytica]UJP38721.1 CinA family protein [Cellulomonas palmilytica]